MIYGAYEARRAVVDAAHASMEIGSGALRTATEWGLPPQAARLGQAAVQTLSMAQITHERPQFRVEEVVRDGEAIPVHEQAVLGKPFATLQRFVPEDGAELPKVLIVPGLAGHFATLVRNTVATMLADHDVYVTDWHNARDVPLSDGPFGLDEYVSYLIEFLEQVGPGATILAVCQPCVPVLAATAIMAEDENPAAPAGVILMAGPVDARVNPGSVNEAANRYPLSVVERVALTRVPRPHAGAGRKVYPGFLQMGGFLSMSPSRHVKAFGSQFMDVLRYNDDEAARRSDFYEEYFAVLDIAAEFYLDTARAVFRDHDLARGAMRWRGRTVDPGAITQPLFTIEGENDAFCPPGQTAAAQRLCTGVAEADRRHLVQAGVGHYGVFSGSRFEQEIYPQMKDFIAR
ncbi:MAG: polyhydroxyalkanoate depolymerase [Solirubrobacterales bacterium]